MALFKSVTMIFALLSIFMFPAMGMGAEISQFEWIGKNADKVGTWDNGSPDGSLDGHFRMEMSLPEPTEIKSILLYTADENAHPVGGQFWDTAATNYYILGVFDQGTQLNHNHVPSVGTFSGDVQFDLYAADSGWFEKGNWFAIELTLGDGIKYTRLTSIGESLDSSIDSSSASSSEIPLEPPVDSGRSKIESILQGDSRSSESESKEQSSAQDDSAAAILDSWNTGAVNNGPTCSPTLTLSKSHMITYIDTYHWNYGQGTQSGGSISLQNADGEIFGPWQVQADSASGAPNAWWIAHPDEIIPAGNYIIIDSQPETWSWNELSPCGFVKVEGYPVQADPTAKDDTKGQLESKGTVSVYINVDGECSNLIDMLVEGCDKGLPDIAVELTFTYIPPDYSQGVPTILRETTDENGMAYFQDVPAGAKFVLKTAVKTMEKEQEGSMSDPAEDAYFSFDYRCKGSYPEEERKRLEQSAGVGPDGRITGIVTPVCGNKGVICSPECDLYPL
ncbi:MAG: hypothetical protein PHS80_01860 [Methanothrix sp.]|nr:hypothetical protein [Methanothrix sp.]